MSGPTPEAPIPESQPGSLTLGLPLARTISEIDLVQLFGVPSEAYASLGLPGHNGLDLAAAAGELVIAVDDGQLMEIRLDPGGYGVTVKLAHDWGESRYAHGRRGSVPIEFELGCLVRRGERVFLAGDRGHIHLGLRLLGPARPAGPNNAGGFGGYVDPLPHLTGLERPWRPEREPLAPLEEHAATREAPRRPDARAAGGRDGRPRMGRPRDQAGTSTP